MEKDVTEIVVDILIDNIMFDKLLLNFNLELPKNQSMVLGVLYEEKSLPISEIGKKLEISKPQMTVIIDKLIEEDLVERIPDKKDRRVINVNLTTKGKKHLHKMYLSLRDNIKLKLLSLSKEDILTLSNSLQTARSILKKME